MVSVNLIFHIVSAFTFMVLIWYLLHLQVQTAFMRDLIRAPASLGKRVKIDWPEAFLQRFAEVQGIRFQTTGKKLAPQKVDLKLWMDLHAALGLEAIEWDAPRCRLIVTREVELGSWRSRVETALQGKIHVEWANASPQGE